jgi:CYTH domain-containing protein/predicted ATPase
MSEVKQIAIVGAPASGKTAVLEALKAEFGDLCVFIEEIASFLTMKGGLPLAGRELSYSELWLSKFQGAIVPVQINSEDLWQMVAKETGAKLVFCDRGVLDGAAYGAGTVDQFLFRYGLDLQSCLERYHMVIVLETTAVCCPELYTTENNPSRHESREAAAALHPRIIEAWSGHPNMKIIPGKDGLKSVISQVLALVSPLVNQELEKKYLLSKMPEIALPEPILVRQVYLAKENGEIRYRQFGDKYYHAAKSDGDDLRREHERPIEEWIFDIAWSKEDAPRIEKLRYLIPYDDHTLELDKYIWPRNDLVVLECEFPNGDKAEADHFILPEWASEAIDVTFDKKYKNKNLAK